MSTTHVPATDSVDTISESASRREIMQAFRFDLENENVECTDDGIAEWADAYATARTVYYSDALAHFAGWVFWSEDGEAVAQEIEGMGGAEILGEDLSPTAYVTRYTALALYFQAQWAATEALNADGVNITD